MIVLNLNLTGRVGCALDFRIYTLEIFLSCRFYKATWAQDFILQPDEEVGCRSTTGARLTFSILQPRTNDNKNGVLLLPWTGPLCLHLHPLRLANVSFLPFLFSYPMFPLSTFRFTGSLTNRFQSICLFHFESSIVLAFYCFHFRNGSWGFLGFFFFFFLFL